MKLSLISVIIPVYNVEKYLTRCLDSVLAQTYTNLEILLIDDGSTDASGKICDKYARQDKRVRVFHKPNGGVSSARNMGLDNASGDYIGFVDSDDYIDPTMYVHLSSLINIYQTDIAVCNIYYCSSKKEFKASHPGKIYKGMEAFALCVHQKSVFVSIWNKLYKRECIGNIRFSQEKRSEDYKFLYDIFKKGSSLVYSNDVKYFYDVPRTRQNFIGQRDMESVLLKRKMFEQAQHSPNQTETQTLHDEYIKDLFVVYMQLMLENRSSEFPQITTSAKREYISFLRAHYISKKLKLFISLCMCNRPLARWIYQRVHP